VRAQVIYESMFGDNQQVARAIATGLNEGGVQADAVEVGTAPPAVPAEVDLVVVGSPNHAWSMPRPSTREEAAAKTDAPLVSQGVGVREWLESASLSSGTAVAAFDTRSAGPKAVVAFDHASTQIEKGLRSLGGSPLAAAEHFRVSDVTGPLEPGEVDRAQAWGRSLAGRLGAR
jgi:hypothetical protein